MLSVVRMYPAEEQAREAIRQLQADELAGDERNIHVFSPMPGNDAQTIDRAIAHGQLPGAYVHVCRRALEKGYHVLSVAPPFIRGSEAEQVMERCGAVDTDQLPSYSISNPTPLSDLLGIPVLTKYKHTFNIKMLTEPKSKTSSFGIPLLTKPKSKTSSFGFPLLTKPKSKTSSFGLPLLTKPKSKTSSFGIPLLSKPKSKDTSFGFKTISHNPAPLSNMFNIPVLSKKDRD
ncbi:MAG: hypothetical protein AAFO81_15050 [Pseudomonadota bacterium]